MRTLSRLVATAAFVMEHGMVFKQGGVMTPGAFFNGGPVNGYNQR